MPVGCYKQMSDITESVIMRLQRMYIKLTFSTGDAYMRLCTNFSTVYNDMLVAIAKGLNKIIYKLM